jgi:hypothetical protein
MMHQTLIIILVLFLQGVTTLNLMLKIAKETNETSSSLPLTVVCQILNLLH